MTTATRPSHPGRLQRRRRFRTGITFPCVDSATPTKRDIIESMAKARTVERLVENVTRRHDATAKDLAQSVYAILLDLPDGRVCRMYAEGSLTYYVARIVMNEWRNGYSPFNRTVRNFTLRSDELVERDLIDAG